MLKKMPPSPFQGLNKKFNPPPSSKTKFDPPPNFPVLPPVLNDCSLNTTKHVNGRSIDQCILVERKLIKCAPEVEQPVFNYRPLNEEILDCFLKSQYKTQSYMVSFSKMSA